MDWERPPRRGPGPGGMQDLEEFINRLKARYKLSFSGSPIWLGVLLIVLVLAGLSSYYKVEAQERAVVQRFGRFVEIAEAGPHLRLPFGIDTVRKVTSQVMQREYGYRTVRPDVRSTLDQKGHEDESMMLSGDLNVVDVQWTVQYKIGNPVDYLFRVKDPEGTLDDISESVIRRIVGNRYADEILTVGKASISGMAQKEIQEILNTYKTGIQIVTVKLQNVMPPKAVNAAFNEVSEAQQERERMINEAQQSYNQKIPKAQGEARQAVTQAEGYALERINRSEGEVRRFLDIMAEYEKARDVTRSRMYLEAVDGLLTRVDRLFVIDESQRGLMPFLDLNRLSGGSEPAAATDGHAQARQSEAAGPEKSVRDVPAKAGKAQGGKP